jgi:Ulp1 family protease
MEVQEGFLGMFPLFCRRKRSRSRNRSETLVKIKRSSLSSLHSLYTTYYDSSPPFTPQPALSPKSLLNAITEPGQISSLNQAIDKLTVLKGKGEKVFSEIMREKFKTKVFRGNTIKKQSKFSMFLETKGFGNISALEINELWSELTGIEDGEMFAQVKEFKLFGRDVKKLVPGRWLNDEVINGYIRLLPVSPQVYVFTTYFFYILENMQSTVWDKDKLNRILLKSGLVSLFSKMFLVLPVNIKQTHWAVVVINHRECVIEYYDSLSTSQMDYVCSVVEEFMRVMGCKAYDWEAVWTPEQNNYSDCGMFALRVIHALAHNRPFGFTSQEIKYYRKVMLTELKYGKLLVD